MSDESTIHTQIADAVAQSNAAFQMIAHPLALGVQNAVAQQQAYILSNAMISVAAAAILDGKREEAEAILWMPESGLASPDLKSNEE